MEWPSIDEPDRITWENAITQVNEDASEAIEISIADANCHIDTSHLELAVSIMELAAYERVVEPK